MAVSMDNLLGLIQGMQGKTSTQTSSGSSSTTKKSDMTEEGMQRVLDNILRGPGGVKDISGTARGAGLYNSTAEAQMQNDLAARAAGELERLRAGETTESTQESTTVLEQPGFGISGLLKPMLMASVAKPLINGISGMLQGDDFMNASGLSGLMGSIGGGGSGLSAGLMQGPALHASLGQTMGGAGLGSTLAGVSGAALNSGFSNALDATLSNLTVGSGFDLGAGLADSASFIPSTATMGLSAIPGAGSFLGGLLSGASPEDMDGLGLGTSAMAGAAALGPVGLLAAPAMAILGRALGGASIVCTALMKHGLLDKDEYKLGEDYLANLNPDTKFGYHMLFCRIAAEIAENKDSRWTKVCLPFARSRTKLIAARGKMGWKRWVRYPLGTVTKVIGEPICWGYAKYLHLRSRLGLAI